MSVRLGRNDYDELLGRRQIRVACMRHEDAFTEGDIAPSLYLSMQLSIKASK